MRPSQVIERLPEPDEPCFDGEIDASQVRMSDSDRGEDELHHITFGVAAGHFR